MKLATEMHLSPGVIPGGRGPGGKGGRVLEVSILSSPELVSQLAFHSRAQTLLCSQSVVCLQIFLKVTFEVQSFN